MATHTRSYVVAEGQELGVGSGRLGAAFEGVRGVSWEGRKRVGSDDAGRGGYAHIRVNRRRGWERGDIKMPGKLMLRSGLT